MNNQNASDNYESQPSIANDQLPLEVGVSTLISVFARRFLTILIIAIPLILISTAVWLFSDYSQYVSVVLLGNVTIIWALFTISLFRKKASSFDKAIKRLVDIVLSFVLLVSMAPLLLIIALSIKIDSKSPVFYSKQLKGKGGKQFKLLRFSTMGDNSMLQGRGAVDPLSSQGHSERPKQILLNPRVTRIGRFLRKMNLDELPQLINILIGDMSLVGPRPLFPHEADRETNYVDIFRDTRPGMTGLWQVSERNTQTKQDERFRLDEYYVNNWSLSLDVIILAKTFASVFRSAGGV